MRNTAHESTARHECRSRRFACQATLGCGIQSDLDACDDGAIDGYITATTITTIAYITGRHAGKDAAHQSIRVCLDAFTLSAVDAAALELAYTLAGDDFEDNLQIACATTSGLDAIITRDKTGFVASAIAVLTPTEALSQLPPKPPTP